MALKTGIFDRSSFHRTNHAEVMKIARTMRDPKIEAAETAIRWRSISYFEQGHSPMD